MNQIQIPDAKLTTNFDLYEFLRSSKAQAARFDDPTTTDINEALGIDNTPSRAALDNLYILARHLEAVRDLLACKIIISSGYRCLALNRALKSKDNSDHVLGLAADFTSPAFGSPEDICHRIVSSDIPFKQLIFEHTWVHIAFDPAAARPKRQVLTLMADKSYAVGIVEKATA